ncbi:prolipoprotein diacylglyceryl transferase family protein [Arthrobacter sp. ISL-72]|uniref:prolipoprotein diacylglyceryl transferase family protein n=1 Tax=Arthrobacter sp. ISL-72 TaxID=2819114 RepID=UPI002035D680|nr:prolipoprotein diacylglyceryl transferase family protein [Arthrobacter sp. ISL-72]
MRASVLPSFIRSPTVSAFELGPLTIRFYALCIVAGIVVGTWLAARRLRAPGGTTPQALDIYHVITDNQLYFGSGKDPVAGAGGSPGRSLKVRLPFCL